MRQCLSEPIPEIFIAAAKLSLAVDAHLVGDTLNAARLFREADDPAVWDYTDRAWGAGAKQRFDFVQVENAPPHLRLEDRPKPRMPTREDTGTIIGRDGYHCRFCGIPVINPVIRKLIHASYPDAAPWGRSNVSQHAAFQCMWMQFDHILPNSRGGDSSVANVVITCAPCNFSRMEFTLEEARLDNPLNAPTPVKWDGFKTWDGLERFR